MAKRSELRNVFLWSCAIASCTSVGAAPTVLFDSFVETKVIGTPLATGSSLSIEGQLRDVGGAAIQNRLFFRPGSTSLALSAGWLTAPDLNRTVGVNIDLLDFNNTVVATDSFQGVNGGLALSQFSATNLVAGAEYQLVFTGTAGQAGRYVVNLASGVAAAPVAAVPVVSPAANALVFDTHSGSKNLGRNFANGDELFIDGAMPDDALSAINNDFHFTLTAGMLSAGIEWIFGDLSDPQRTVGVNVDIFDASSNVVATDLFQGLFGGQAFSQINGVSLLPGNYTLRFTGTAGLAGRYRVHLTTNATAPGFEPIVDAPPTGVPEPGSLMLASLALALMLARAAARPARQFD